LVALRERELGREEVEKETDIICLGIGAAAVLAAMMGVCGSLAVQRNGPRISVAMAV